MQISQGAKGKGPKEHLSAFKGVGAFQVWVWVLLCYQASLVHSLPGCVLRHPVSQARPRPWNRPKALPSRGRCSGRTDSPKTYCAHTHGCKDKN